MSRRLRYPYSSETDGIDHINVYSKGRTELGRLLTNFAPTPFDCEDGHFESVEGYWFWLTTRDDDLRALHGFNAKEYGRTLLEHLRKSGQDFREPDFMGKIKRAIAIKILTSEKLTKLLADSHLPLAHYYEYILPRGGVRVIHPEEHEWIMHHLEDIRRDLKAVYYSN